MKKYLLILLGFLLGVTALTAYAATPTVQVINGGTGSTTLTGILVGNGTSPIQTAILSGCSLSGFTLTCSGGGGTFPFTVFPAYNGTSTPIGFSAGAFTNGSTTVTSVGSGFVGANNGLLYSVATSSLSNVFFAQGGNAFGASAVLGTTDNRRLGILTNNLARESILATGEVGISSTSPFAKLSVHANNGDTDTVLFAVGSSTQSATTTLFTISNTGTASTTNLVVSSAGGSGIRCAQFGADGTLSANASACGSGGASTDFSYLTVNSAVAAATSSPFAVFNAAYFGATGTTTITSAGFLGVGTTSPDQALAVNGSLDISVTGSYNIGDILTGYASTTNQSVVWGQNSGALLNASSTILGDTVIGYNALNGVSTTGGQFNTIIGAQAVKSGTNIANDVIIGYQAGTNYTNNNTQNTIIGTQADEGTNAGNNITAVGFQAMINHGGTNVAVGTAALGGNGGGAQNTSVGNNSLSADTSGTSNTALGTLAGQNVTTGSKNVLVGAFTASTTALQTGSGNIAVGYDLLLPGTNPSNELNIGNAIFGTGLTGEGTTIAGNIGIGSSTPFGKLSVSGGDTYLQETTDSNTALNVVSSIGTSTFQVGTINTAGNYWTVASSTGAIQLALNGSGLLGIGTTSQSAQLSVFSASSTIPEMISGVIGGVTYIFHEMDIYAHEMFSGPVPALSSCGTSPSFIGAANDNAMAIQVGSVSASGCTVTFAKTWGTAPVCNVTERTGSVTNALSYTVSTTQVVVSQTAITSDILDISCRGTQ